MVLLYLNRIRGDGSNGPFVLLLSTETWIVEVTEELDPGS